MGQATEQVHVYSIETYIPVYISFIRGRGRGYRLCAKRCQPFAVHRLAFGVCFIVGCLPCNEHSIDCYAMS
jgi:hypothetical protein